MVDLQSAVPDMDGNNAIAGHLDYPLDDGFKV